MGRPTFLATVDDRTLLVALDSSAIMALTSGDSRDHDAILDVRRGMIRQAAQRLYDQRLCTVTDQGTEILISSLDLGADLD